MKDSTGEARKVFDLSILNEGSLRTSMKDFESEDKSLIFDGKRVAKKETKETSQKNDLYSSIWERYKQGKVAFDQAEEKGSAIIEMQDDEMDGSLCGKGGSFEKVYKTGSASLRHSLHGRIWKERSNLKIT